MAVRVVAVASQQYCQSPVSRALIAVDSRVIVLVENNIVGNGKLSKATLGSVLLVLVPGCVSDSVWNCSEYTYIHRVKHCWAILCRMMYDS